MLRATFKSLLSRKLRLLLSGLAVVLGVMAVSAAFILSQTLTSSFETLFDTVNEDVDVSVSGKANLEAENGADVTQPVPESLISEIRGIPGVRDADGSIAVEDGGKVVNNDTGKVITAGGPPRLGVGWPDEDTDFFTIDKGAAPTAPDQVAINTSLADKGDFQVGDTITVLTPFSPGQQFTLSGIFNIKGDRATLGGETYVAFTQPVAQELLLGEPNVFSSVDVKAESGVSENTLKDRIEAKVSSDYEVKTSAELRDEMAGDIGSIISIFRNVLLGFATIALFVGIFLILNTFSIIVAQRTKELALFRAMGASRKQVVGSVLVEAIVIGLIASTLGFLAGIGIATLLRAFFENAGDASLPGGLKIPVIAVVASYLVGIVVTIVAALLPAVRASRIPPVAAMRDAETQQKPLIKISIAGGIVTLAGVVLMAMTLFGDSFIWLLAIGVLLAFIGIAMLTPVIAKPVIDVVGRVFSWSLPGKLGRRNSARNPRRTAITAAALMVGVALVTGVSVIASTFTAGFEKIVKRDIKAELIITGDFSSGGLPQYDPAVIPKLKELPGVANATAVYADEGELAVDGEKDEVKAFVQAGDVEDFAKMFTFDIESGQARTLQPGEMMVDSEFADNHDIKVGDTIPVTLSRGEPREETVVGIYRNTDLIRGPIISVADAEASFRTALPIQGYIDVDNSANVDTVQREADKILADQPEVSVQSQQELADQASTQINQLLVMIYVLLGLAIIIAVLGIINTLALSILERTRELGLLRAVGLTRMQTTRMVTVESIVISVFGALLGLAVGSLLGVAIVEALAQDEEIFSELDFPLLRMTIFLVLAIVVGLFAAIIPAIKAARTNVLRAIAYE